MNVEDVSDVMADKVREVAQREDMNYGRNVGVP